MTPIQTVLGAIDSSALGFTLAHEHVIATPGMDNFIYPWRYDRQKTLDWAIERMTQLKAGGVDAIIDMTTPDLGRDIEFMADVSRGSGVHVVATTGLWRDPPRSVMERSEDATAELFIHEIEHGIGSTSIRAGVIKVANDVEGITPAHERVLRAAARASKRTGCPINTHSNSALELGSEQVRIFQEEGVQMDRVAIGHTADTTDIAYLERLLNAGVYLTMDRYPGRTPTWEQRNVTVKALIDRGWGDRIMLGHDGWAAAWVWAGREIPRGGGSTAYNPDGMLFLSRVGIPGLLNIGVSQDAIDRMTRETPRRFLSGEGV
ncbi:MAG: hypothetical protein DWI58_21720 [Chloroflexi bacterium]|nr:MAG: hypothetical protein DWI58_21720 [Chloroflexota bacterium]